MFLSLFKDKIGPYLKNGQNGGCVDLAAILSSILSVDYVN